MNTALYESGKWMGRFVVGCTTRRQFIRADIPRRDGGYILALTHLGNVDPLFATVLIPRRVRWMARREFFRFKAVAWFLRKIGAFSVNRQGVPVSAIRQAIQLARGGEVVGICPEGGRPPPGEAAVLGGPIKRGACSVAIRAGVPIVPCVMLGTADLNRIGPWLPAKRIRLWVAYGQPIHASAHKSTRATRDALREQLRGAYVRLYRELRSEFAERIDTAPVIPSERSRWASGSTES